VRAQIVILNGPPRSGKSSIAVAIQAGFDGGRVLVIAAVTFCFSFAVVWLEQPDDMFLAD
jgi:chloramphenicol 3-O-phosphotransferase